jgi:hypothetical protein
MIGFLGGNYSMQGVAPARQGPFPEAKGTRRACAKARIK